MTEEDPLPVEEGSKESPEQSVEKAEQQEGSDAAEGETSLKLILVLPGVSKPQEIVVSVYEW